MIARCRPAPHHKWALAIGTVKDHPYNLQRFVNAQNVVCDQICAELRAGRKRSHWMWFIFPQLAGLGSSDMAVKYAIRSRAEAEAYLAHNILGARSRECTQFVNAIAGRSIRDIFGYPDDLKFHSSMTLFANVTSENQIFNDALQKYFSGKSDQRTLTFLGF
jgi:uncharacterized protein (DUF1810 family)